MKNLEVWDVSLQKLKLSTDDKYCICSGHDEDSTVKSLYVCSSDLIVRSYDAESGEIRWSKDISDIASPNNKPVNVTCLALQNFLCIGLENGEMLTVKDAGQKTQLVGVSNSGLCAMEWSPDHEMVSLVTQEMNTCLLSCLLEPVCEVNLWDQDFGHKQFITVGWGKKETQFHGSAGKQAAKLKDDFDIDLSNPVADKRVKIAWRGDGILYAIGFSMDGIRRFKVFDREGRLMYTSEKQPGLESNIAWRPCGNIIATTQKVADKYTVSFFEKNGLKHGEIILNVNSKTLVEDILWSTDSEILTLQCRDTETDIQTLLLYTTGNYHWYLKQTLTFNSDQKINKVFWDTDFDMTLNKMLHVSLLNGQYYSYTWIWNTNHSLGTTVNDDAVVVVIDEKKLLITGFRQAVVPPPMAALEITLDTYVLSVHFAPKHAEKEIDSNTFFVFTADNRLIFYEQTLKFPLQYKEQKVIQFDKYEYPFQYYNWYWIKTNTLLCVTMDKDSCYILVEYTLDGDTLVKKDFAHIHDSITRIQPHPTDPNVMFLQLKSGEIVEYKLMGGLEPLHKYDPCPTFSVVAVGDKLHFMAVTHKGFLYIDGVLIMSSVSSIFIHTHFLLITTLQHVLLCTELTEAGFDAVKESEKKESEHLYKRKIERGARIVVVVPCDTRTVFQMPRGNLEAIQPRPLSLKIVGVYLDSLKYFEAFDLMRKQRINLNLLYDHNPESFIQNIDVFLESIQKNSWLNLFLSDLENSDVTKTMYSSCYVSKNRNSTQRENHAKIENVCNMVREHLNKRSDSDSKVLPLITTFVKKNTVEELEKALSIIKELKIQESEGCKLPVGPDEALKYLLYMVDVNQLFDVALGMYDFDLVLLVANKSQKDPKEFIPMLNELNEMDENYKRFTINKHLKRYNKAVDCLVNCGSSRHQELRSFVKYHSLYKEALAKFSREEEIYKQISEDFGLYLKLEKNFTQAGIIYERAKSIDKAIECYKEALEWEMALKLALSWPKEKFVELCWDLIKDLKEEKRHSESLVILDQFCDDFEATISYATECRHFKTALRLCEQHQKQNYKDEKILPALLEETKNLQDLIEANWSTFINYRQRLYTVREMKQNAPASEKTDNKNNNNKDWDLFSDVTSTIASSKGSSRSHRSSKNKRKHERKIASLKEGSKFEDVALVLHLHNLVTSSFELRMQVKEIVTVLSLYNKEKEALFLQTSLEKLLKEMKDSFKGIWTHELTLEAAIVCIAAENSTDGSGPPQGIHSLDTHIRIAPVIQELNWKVEGLN